MKTIQQELKFSNLSWNESTDVAQNHQVEEHARKEVKTDSEQPDLLPNLWQVCTGRSSDF